MYNHKTIHIITSIIVKKAILGSFLFVIICSAVPALAAEGFTQKDRDMLIELKVKMGEIDNRFEQVDKRFEEILTFLAILAGVFGSIVIAVFGFAYWDRRAILARAREEVRQTRADRNLIEKNSLLLTKLTEAMRRMADKSPDIREALQHSNLL
jgi:hypothetical protein